MTKGTYYVVRRHTLGGYTCTMGFIRPTKYTGDENVLPVDVPITNNHPQFETPQQAAKAAWEAQSEYGVVIHPEVKI